MTTYCSVSDSYLNKDILSNNLDLDKMAREVNNKKKKLNKGIKAFNKIQDERYDKGTKVEPTNKFFSAYETGNGYFPLIKEHMDKNNTSDVISLDTPSECISDESSVISSISWESNEIDKEIKSKTKYNKNKKSKRHKCTDFDLKSIDSLESIDSGESLLRHIRFCLECKDKIMELIKKNKLDENRTDKNKCLSDIKHTDKSKQQNIELETRWMPELKEILTVFLVGLLVVIILDLFMRNDSTH